MNAGIAAYVILTQNTDVTDIVGVNIFPEVAEQETATPFIVYQLQSVAPEDTHDGPSKLDEVRFEFLCYADTYALAADLGDKVRGALDRVSGTYNGVNVESVQFNDVDIDTIDAPRRFAQVLTFTFRIKRDDFTIAQGTPVTGAKIGDLYDVDVTGVTDGQVLAYDASVQEWQPADDAGGVTELGQLTDVQFGQGGPETGELLKYDGSEWTNDSLVKSEIGLGNVDNTSDADKPVSTATQTALSAKANSADFSNVDNTSDADKPVSTATQTALNAKADTSAVPTDLNDLSDVTIVGTPVGNQALIYDATAGAFKSQVSYTNRFEDEVENGLQMPSVYFERGYSVKSEGDGIFIDPSPDTPTAGKVIVRKIYHKTGFISDADVIGDYTLIHTFADDTAYADTVAVFDGFEDGATYGVPPFTLAQTWEEVTAAPAFTGLLNETYGSGAEAAYSTRRLNGNVTDCMVIRRASDSTTTTIGFDGEDIDEAAIETFCTGTTCTVSEWTDQSGNGNDATQSDPTKQPTIYTGGALVKENGKVAVDFDGANDYLIYSGATGITTVHFYGVYSVDSHGTYGGIFSFKPNGALNDYNSTSGKALAFQHSSAGYSSFVANGMSLVNSDSSFTYPKFLLADIYQDSGAGAFWNSYLNNELTGTYSYTIDEAQGYVFGARITNGNPATFGNVKWSEAIIYPSNRNTNRITIRENIGDYFTQNTPLLDTYTGAAAAYSLRKLRTAYTGDAVEVYNGSSYADIGFNVFGELDTVALAAHCGSNDGFVSKWYSQTGSNDATQTVTGSMPKIYDGTTGVVTENGKPALDYNNDVLIAATSATITSESVMIVATQSSSGRWNRIVSQNATGTNDASSYIPCIRQDNTTNIGGFDGSLRSTVAFTYDQQFLFEGYNTGSALTNYVDTVTGTSSSYSLNETINELRLGNGRGVGSSEYLIGKLQEVIVYHSDQSSNRAGIETNINTFYDIF